MVIVGAGPTGLTLSRLRAQLGVRSLQALHSQAPSTRAVSYLNPILLHSGRTHAGRQSCRHCCQNGVCS